MWVLTLHVVLQHDMLGNWEHVLPACLLLSFVAYLTTHGSAHITAARKNDTCTVRALQKALGLNIAPLQQLLHTTTDEVADLAV